MRVKFRTYRQPKNVARSIRRYLRAQGRETSLSWCLELCARMFGHRNWNELLADVGPDGCAPPDIYAPPDEQVRRVAQYLEVLQRFGFDSDKAWDLLEGAQARGWL